MPGNPNTVKSPDIRSGPLGHRQLNGRGGIGTNGSVLCSEGNLWKVFYTLNSYVGGAAIHVNDQRIVAQHSGVRRHVVGVTGNGCHNSVGVRPLVFDGRSGHVDRTRKRDGPIPGANIIEIEVGNGRLALPDGKHRISGAGIGHVDGFSGVVARQ